MFIFSLLPHLLDRSLKAKCVAAETKNNYINNISLRRCVGMIAIVFTLISFSSMAQTWSHLIEGTYGGKLLKNSQGDMLLTGEARYPIMSEMAINQVEHPVYDYVYQLTAKPDILWGTSFSDENEALTGLVSGHFIIKKTMASMPYF
ncbi:hypothetical protein [Shewanella surugensis]|uniref:Uncharacterized protein n=1 Tax=Shewanella surugensis TaxID=212020 RepID=A0ABT0LA37_9GAMM|nr:hypothetical protein [Shewanella surugensis]MCL1124505.1 hypothetical protein [Shewanella surugensis]